MQKLASKFIEVMQECRHIAKNGTNTFHKYKYATSADVLEKVNAALVKHGIASTALPEIISITDVQTAKGSIEHLATVKVEILLIDKESGEQFVLCGLGSGQDSGDKAVMKAQTAAIKYAYMLSLAISTGDDPEADQKTDETSATINHPSMASQTSSQNARTMSNKNAVAICQDCGVPITQKVVTFSMKRYGHPLCIKCQQQAASIA